MIKKFVIPSLIALSISGGAIADGLKFSGRGKSGFKFETCFVVETHKADSYKSQHVNSALETDPSVCSIFIPKRNRTYVGDSQLKDRLMSYIEMTSSTKVWMPEKYKEYAAEHYKDLESELIYYPPPDEKMAKRLKEILEDFQLDAATVHLLYDDSSVPEKKAWQKNLKGLKVKPAKLGTRNALRKYLRGLSKEKNTVVIVNLLSVVEDTEYSRLLRYEDIKHEIKGYNIRHLTVGVEEAYSDNEAIVFDHNVITGEVRAFINKERFHELNLQKLYLNSDWRLLGGLLRVRGTEN